MPISSHPHGRVLGILTAAVVGLAGLTAISPPRAVAATVGAANPAPIAIPHEGTVQSSAEVSGVGSLVFDVEVSIHGLSHSFPADLDIWLVHDTISVLLMSDACGGIPINGTFTFDDEAASTVPAGSCTPTTYRPTDVNNDEASLDTVPDGTIAHSDLSAFDGQGANGSWSLVVTDDFAEDSGTIASGFSVTIDVPGAAQVLIYGSGPATSYPYAMPVTNQPGNVTDVDVVLHGLRHEYPDDLDILLVGPTGRTALLVSDTCGWHELEGVTWRLDDSAATALPDSDPCSSGSFRPANYIGGDEDALDTLEAPAPPPPYGTTLATFNGTPANGTWKLYVRDDYSADDGYLDSASLVITTDAPPNTTITKKPKKKTDKRKATITFTSDQAGSTYQCKVDKKKWKACDSPLKLKKLTPGKHKVQVRAPNSAGLTDPTPAKATWKIRR